MAGKPLPGHPGVTIYPPGEMPPGSYVVKNPDGSIFADADGNTYAGRYPNTIEKILPYAVAGAFVAPYAAAALGGALGGGGGSSVAAEVAGVASHGVPAATASSWLAPALKYGLPVATNIAGSVIQAKSNTSAAKMQAALTEKALDDARAQRDIDNRHYDEQIARQQEVQGYNRQQYSDFSKSLEPYRQAGLTASDRMSMLLKQRYS